MAAPRFAPLFLLILLGLGPAAVARGATGSAGSVGSVASKSVGDRVARKAASLVGHRSLREVAPGARDDCSGLVKVAVESAGIDLGRRLSRLPRKGRSGGVESLYRLARRSRALRRGSPRRGDLVFFHDTYDRHRDGFRSAGLTHVGIVDSVATDGEVTFVHRTGTGIQRSRLDPRHPGLYRDPQGRVHNDYVRRRSATAGPGLAGQLLRGFAAPDRLR